MRPLDLSNQRFGYIIAQKPTGDKKQGSVMWECLCDCGNICQFSAKELIGVKSKSCGCINPFVKDLKGQVFGELEVLEITDKRQCHGKHGGGSVVWKCMCHGCGNECYLSSRTLLINEAKSCGCRNRLEDGQAAFNCIRNDYIKAAKKKGVIWKLSDKQVKKLIFNECHYCGVGLLNEITKNRGTYNGYTKYNGIDRVDNTKGYTIDNVVSCCKHCNRAKRTMTLSEWENYIRRLYNHYIVKKKNPLVLNGLLKTRKNE